MKSVMKRISICLVIVLILAMLTVPMFAEETVATATDANNAVTVAAEASESGVLSAKAIAAAIAIALAALGGALGMGIAIAKSSESIARQPEASGEIRTSLMLGLVFVETAIIYALIVAILIIFVL